MYSLGIDLGGTNIVASVVDDQYNIISTAKTKTNAPRPANAIFDDVEKVCREAVREAAAGLHDNPPAEAEPDMLAETLAFLVWFDDDNFVFLGYRRYAFAHDGAGEPTGYRPPAA